MTRRAWIGIALCPLLLAAISCGEGGIGSSSPPPKDGVLLRASELGGMRLDGQFPAPDPETFANSYVCCGELFKDEPDVAAGKMKDLGFKRAYLEGWLGGVGDLQGMAFAAEFDTADHARAALDYMNTELFRECPGSPPYCTERRVVKLPGIPNSIGQAVTPLRPANEGRRSTAFKMLFRIGAVIYGQSIGGGGNYDPGAVTQSQALDVFKRFYDRVKNASLVTVLRSAPPSPLGPPP